MQHEVVGPTGDRERVELDRAEPAEDLEHRVGASLERTRRREEVPGDEKAPRGLGSDLHAEDASSQKGDLDLAKRVFRPPRIAVDANSVKSYGPHPRRIGWVGTTALAMGGSNQSLFLIGALVVSQGTAAVPLLAVGLLLSWAAARVDRARADVAQPRRRDRGDVRGGVPPVQPGAREPDRRLLLVGLGADVRPDRDPVGVRAAPVVPARRLR